MPCRQINNIMPAPGTGYTGSSPQEVLLLVSDGVDDRLNTGNPGLAQNPVGTYSGSRFMGLFDTSWCDTVKARGIRIAVLYTEYLPLPTNAWYNTYRMHRIRAKSLQTCRAVPRPDFTPRSPQTGIFPKPLTPCLLRLCRPRLF